MIRWNGLWSLVVVGFAAPACLAQNPEMVENPTYASWVKFKKGTSLVMKSVNEFSGTQSESTVTIKLVDFTPEKVTLETASTIVVNGMAIQSPGAKIDHPKMLPLPAGTKKEDYGKPAGTTAEGEETIKIGTQEYKTKWYKSKTKSGDNEVEAQVWTHDGVPGKMVKMVTKTTGKISGTSTMEVIGLKQP